MTTHQPRTRARLMIAAACLTAIAALVTGCRSVDSAALRAAAPVVDTATIAQLPALLARAHAVAALPDVPGYQRSCARGKACSFGPAWTDDTTAPGSHNGCDTRNDQLGQQLSNATFKPGTRKCKVIGGTLHDPYSGRAIAFTPGARTPVQIDHVAALDRVWNAGASTWPLAQRERIANDPANLIAVNSSDNESKGSQGPDTWLPDNPAFRCTYITRYFQITDTYHLAVTRGDVAVARDTCLPTHRQRPRP